MPAIFRISTWTRAVAVLLIGVTSVLATTLTASILAHEGRIVGEYNLVVGFLHEPAYEGQLNAVSLVVTNPSSDPEDNHHETAPADHHHGTQPAEDDHHATDTINAEAGDVRVHGAVFTSSQIATGEHFEFDIPEELGGIEIPYHVHPGDQEGVIVVSTRKADHGHDKSIKIMDDHVVPDRVEVFVGDTVVWTNRESHSAVVMSGPLSPVTSEMTASISDATTSVADDAETPPNTPRNRVSGLASNLQVEVFHLSTNASRVLSMTERVDDPGHYIAEFVPTAPGDYRVRFFGSIEGNAIDETFDSGPDTFDTVIPSDAIQFPIVLESNREIQNATQGALNAVQELETDLESTSSNASTGMIIGIVGILFGLIAIGTSFFAITIARRRN